MSPTDGQTVGDVGEFGVIAGHRAAAAGPPRCCSAPATTQRSWPCPTGGWWPRPTCWSRGGTSVATGRTPVDIGHKAVAQNLADIAAMGAAADRAARRARRARRTCRAVGASTSPTACVTRRARSAPRRRRRHRPLRPGRHLGDRAGRPGGPTPVTRSGALPGDVVAVAGRLGWAAGGLAVLQRGFRMPRAARGRSSPTGAAVRPRPAGGARRRHRHVRRERRAGRRPRSRRSRPGRRRPAGGGFPVAAPLQDAAAALGVDPMSWISRAATTTPWRRRSRPTQLPEGFMSWGASSALPNGRPLGPSCSTASPGQGPVVTTTSRDARPSVHENSAEARNVRRTEETAGQMGLLPRRRDARAASG